MTAGTRKAHRLELSHIATVFDSALVLKSNGNR